MSGREEGGPGGADPVPTTEAWTTPRPAPSRATRVKAWLRALRHSVSGGALPGAVGDPRFIDKWFVQRYWSTAALALAALIVDGLGPVVAAMAVGIGFPLNLGVHRWAKRHGRIPVLLHVVDLTAAVAIAWMVPAALVPVAMLVLATVAVDATLSGSTSALALALGSTIGLALVQNHHHTPDGELLILGFAIAAITVSMVAGRLRATEGALQLRLNTILDNLDTVLWVRDPVADRFTFVNEQGPELFGWSEEMWLQPGFWQRHIHPDDRATVVAVMDHATSLGLDHEANYRFETSDGRWLHLHDRVSALLDSTGETVAMQGMSIDMSDRVLIEQRVNQYADIVDRIDLALVVFQHEGETLRLRAANPAASRLMGRDLSTSIGGTLEDAFPVLAGSRLTNRLVGVITREVPLRVDDILVHPSQSEPRVVTLRAFPLPGESVGVSLQDVTDAVAASEALRRQALYDSLTGLPNRRLLDDELHRGINRTPLPGEAVALLVMDLDQFKEVNDALGHHVGDQLLRSIGDRLTRDLDNALVARLGGDEFAVVISGLVGVDDVRKVAEGIRRTLAEPFVLDEVRIQSNASIGIALYPHHARDVATLIQRADVAMYVAKRTGSGIAVYSAEQDRSSVERLTLIGELPDAAPKGQFVLHYQPCLNLRTGEPVRAEALIRWNHPRLGLVGPDQFVELAELSGAIQPLTRWVIAEGLGAMRQWQDLGHHLGLAINLSVRNLYDPELVPFLADTLARHRLEPSDLVLELTETELMDDPGLAREVFTKLGELGVNTSIDDFGTGYSSLTYLRDLPLQEIKIDRSFVREMHRRSDEFTIVRSMIDLGHNLGLEVVAEGVEHLDDLHLLQRLGCDLGQGYEFSRPLPMDELVQWLDERAAHAPSPPCDDWASRAAPSTVSPTRSTPASM